MFNNKKVDAIKKAVSELYNILGGYFSYYGNGDYEFKLHSFHSRNPHVIDERINKLEKKIDKLVDALGYEYKTDDNTLPKFVKKKVKK